MCATVLVKALATMPRHEEKLIFPGTDREVRSHDHDLVWIPRRHEKIDLRPFRSRPRETRQHVGCVRVPRGVVSGGGVDVVAADRVSAGLPNSMHIPAKSAVLSGLEDLCWFGPGTPGRKSKARPNGAMAIVKH